MSQNPTVKADEPPMHTKPEIYESLVFLVDVQNLYCSVRESYGLAARVDFKKLRDAALKGRRFRHILSRAYFAAKPEESLSEEQRKAEKSFLYALRKMAYEVKRTRIRPHERGAPSGTNIDSQLVTDVVNLSVNGHPPSVIVIASGDSDFVPVYETLRAKGSRVEVLAFTPSLASQISTVVDEVTDLGREYLFADFYHDAPAPTLT